MSPYTLIKINATESTNTYLKDLSRSTRLKDATVVVTSHQSKGRGQQGASWFSEDEKSLTFSLYKVFEDVSVINSYYISMAVALGITEILKSFNLPDVKVKWPNDIMSRNKKCGGVLIENFLQNNNIKASVIGVGLNVNNLAFVELPHATSMRLASGQIFTISELLDKVICNILKKLHLLETRQFELLHKQYHNTLFAMDMMRVFEDIHQIKFNGIIKGVTNKGFLQVFLDSGELKLFALKELKFCL